MSYQLMSSKKTLSMTIHKSPLSMRSFSTDYLPVELIYKSKMLPTETAHTALNWFLNGEYLDSSPILHIWIVYLSNFDKCINFYQLQESNKGIQHRPRLSTPVMENSCLLFCSCHQELVILKNSRIFASYFDKKQA